LWPLPFYISWQYASTTLKGNFVTGDSRSQNPVVSLELSQVSFQSPGSCNDHFQPEGEFPHKLPDLYLSEVFSCVCG
jgi:hypothetical protein